MPDKCWSQTPDVRKRLVYFQNSASSNQTSAIPKSEIPNLKIPKFQNPSGWSCALILPYPPPDFTIMPVGQNHQRLRLSHPQQTVSSKLHLPSVGRVRKQRPAYPKQCSKSRRGAVRGWPGSRRRIGGSWFLGSTLCIKAKGGKDKTSRSSTN